MFTKLRFWDTKGGVRVTPLFVQFFCTIFYLFHFECIIFVSMKRVLKDGNKWYGIREWKCFELTSVDPEDDFDYAADFYEQQPRKGKVKPKETVDQFALFENLLRFNVFVFTLLKIGFAHLYFTKKNEYYCKNISPKAPRHRQRQGGPKPKVEEIKETGVRALANSNQLVAELDTCRVYFPCQSYVDIPAFIGDNSLKAVRSVVRNPFGQILDDREYYHTEMMCSWWGKMSLTEETRRWGHNGKEHCQVLCFEFSVAKWWHYSSAANSGDEPCADLILVPCMQAMSSLHIELYSSLSREEIMRRFLREAEIRRLDLSLNFKVPEIYTASEYVNLIGKCRINQQSAHPYDDGSIGFATEKSPYRVIFYDKEKEAKKYYTGTCRFGKKYIYFEDENGNYFETQNPEGTLKEKVWDENQCKKEFYEKNKHHFKNNLRYEVQFRTKFFQEHNLMTTGRENIDNCINLCKFVWVEVLDRIDEQLGRTNFTYKDKAPVVDVLERIKRDISNEVISDTKGNNMIGFVMDCYRDWREVKARLGRNLYSQKKKAVKVNYNYDVEIPGQLPIMRIM